MTDEQDKPDNVLTFRRAESLADGGPVRRARKDGPRCEHFKHTALVDPDDRTVECGKCGADLDAFALLDKLARSLDWPEARLAKTNAEAEVVKLRKEIERLKRGRVAAAQSGYVAAGSVRLALDDIIRRLRKNAASGSVQYGWTAPDVCSSAARMVETAKTKLLFGTDEQGAVIGDEAKNV
jgi:hypothetical protein